MKTVKTFCSWSGGKESSMAFHEARKSGAAVIHLLNMASSDGAHSRTHGIDSSRPALLAKAIGLPIVRKTTSWDGYEETCGEEGEHHTIVYDDPIFRTPLAFKASQKILRDNNWLLKVDHPMSREGL